MALRRALRMIAEVWPAVTVVSLVVSARCDCRVVLTVGPGRGATVVGPSVVCGVASTVFVFPNVDSFGAVGDGCTHTVSAGLRRSAGCVPSPPSKKRPRRLSLIVVVRPGSGLIVESLFSQCLAETRILPLIPS